VVGLLTLTTLAVGQDNTEEGQEKPVSAVIDCRYDQRHGGIRELAFSTNDVFRLLLADPKQPQFSASRQATCVSTNQTTVNMRSVGFGENFGF